MTLHKRSHTTFSKQSQKPACATCGRPMVSDELIECSGCRKDAAAAKANPETLPNEELELGDIRTKPLGTPLSELDMFYEPSWILPGRRRR